MIFSNLVELKTFTVFSEYFIGISALYILIVFAFISYSIYGLLLQKALSDCIGLILLMSCYLILNDDLVFSVSQFEIYPALNFYKSIVTDFFSFFTKFIVCFFSALYFFVISDFLKENKLTSFEYLLIILFAVLGLILLCSSNDLLTAYLSIELVSLSSYVLSSFRKTSSYSIESGVKYLITGAISSAFFLLGSSFMYAYVGSISLSDFWSLLSDETWFKQDKLYWKQLFIDLNNNDGDFLLTYTFTTLTWSQWCNFMYFVQLLEFYKFLTIDSIEFLKSFRVIEPFLEIGLTFILFSFLIKLSLAPFHIWSLDVYEGSPTISTFFFAMLTKLSFFVFLVRICYVATLQYNFSWQFYGIVVGLLSIFVGSFGGLRQRKLKTLLAYSSVSHMGYALLAFTAGYRFGLEMLIFYLVIYMLSSLSIWFIILSLQIHQKYYFGKINKELGDLILLRKSNPALAFCLALAIFSIAGIPPLIGFIVKMGIFLSVLNINYYLVALLSILCSVISTFYYIRIIKILYFENFLVGKLYYPIKSGKTILLSISIFLLVFLFVNPNFLYLIINKVVWYSFFADVNLLF